jgi:hypothetical protein
MEDDEDEDDDGRDSEDDNTPVNSALFVPAPSMEEARAALADLGQILRPQRNSGAGYKNPKLDLLLRRRLEQMQIFLRRFMDPLNGHNGWMAASLHTAKDHGGGTQQARRLREWARDYIADRGCLPINIYGTWNSSILEDEDFASELLLHLQSIGKYVRAMDIVLYVDRPEVKTQLKLTKTISLATAQRWMRTVGYRWKKTPSGQYVDGHEHDDVVAYRQTVFLPVWAEMLSRTRVYEAGIECRIPHLSGRRIVIWNHDESTYYPNDRCKIRWVHNSETAVPCAKGEGPSMMIADYASPDYGFLRSPDKTESARVIFKAGKAREGYFKCEDILKQAANAMDLLDKHFPDEEHVFVYDNATTHLKRPDDALSARKMPKFSPKHGDEWDGINWGERKKPRNWGVETSVIDENGKLVYNKNGEVLKKKVRMADGQLADGTPQCLYYPDGHERAGVFKGMAVILEERGYAGAQKLRAQCPKFRCEKGVALCCCRRILYNEPDFVAVESLLETACKTHGYRVLFIPKFHCEVNFIEQCWGYSKRIYRQCPVSSLEADLEFNVLASLDAIPIESMRK